MHRTPAHQKPLIDLTQQDDDGLIDDIFNEIKEIKLLVLKEQGRA